MYFFKDSLQAFQLLGLFGGNKIPVPFVLMFNEVLREQLEILVKRRLCGRVIVYLRCPLEVKAASEFNAVKCFKRLLKAVPWFKQCIRRKSNFRISGAV